MKANLETASGEEIRRLRERVAELERFLAERRGGERFDETAYKAIFDGSPLPVWLNLDNEIVYVNQAALRLLGTDECKVLGRSPYEFIHPGNWSLVNERIRQIRTGAGAQAAVEEVFLRADGTSVDVEVSAWPVPWKDTEAIRVSFIDISLRKQTEQKLAAARAESMKRAEDFDALFRALPIAVAISADAECRTIRSNPVMAKLLGVSPLENTSKSGPNAARMPFRFRKDGVELPNDKLPQQQCGRDGKAREDVELEVERADGGVSYLFGSATPLFNEAGQVRGTIAAFVDVTERRMAERALAESEARFRRFIESCTSGVAFYGFDGRVRYANPALLEMLGHTEEDVERGLLNWRAITPEGSAFRDWMTSEELASTGRCDPYRAELLRRDGKRVAVLVGASTESRCPSSDDAIFVFIVDMTEQARAEGEVRRLNGELAQRLHELETIIELAPVGLGIASDSDCRKVRLNQYLMEYLGTAKGPCRMFHDGAELAAEDGPMQAAARRGQGTRDQVIEVERADGTKVDLLCHASPLLDAEGKPRGSVGAFLDITGRNRIEQELRRSNADLTQFAYAASHDLREPLRMIISFSQLLMRRMGESLEGENKKFLTYVVEGAARMQVLLGDLLTYSRFSHEEQSPGEVDSGEVVARVIGNLGSLMEESGAKVEVGPLPRVEVHEVHLTQLLQNLVSNALKYRRKGVQPRVRISAEENGRDYVFSVEDDGIGIAPEHHGSIFGIFRRLHHAEEYAGTGIGLALSKRIVESYGGRIWVESEEGKGATFRFSLPRQGA